MSIYTKTGDSGETSLFGGMRVLKCNELVDVYGSIDELNSWIGLLDANIKIQNLNLKLEKIQADLFTIGSTLAGWPGDLSELSKQVRKMEEWIDEVDATLPELANFILPGGSELAAKIHITRSICRRVERQVVSLVNGHQPRAINYKPIIQYLNRLSDLFFVLARFINKAAKAKETIWSGIKKK